MAEIKTESQKLKKARAYETEAEKMIREADRPVFHLTPRTGWMNDPNGFSFYKGEYHLFYQYYPYDIHWDSMHWGHAVSRDLLHWRYLPAVLAPDQPYDCGGCFSGTALELDDGRQLLMYTGVSDAEDGSGQQVQTQCLAFGDGAEYEKAPDNPVITAGHLPEGASCYDFRDPKIWREADGIFRCIAVNCKEDQDGYAALFESADGRSWKYRDILEKNNGRFGKMWECPDFFELDGKQVLIVSAQDVNARGMEYTDENVCVCEPEYTDENIRVCEPEYPNGNITMCFLGSYDRSTQKFKAQQDQNLDYGIDFYAPQTIQTPDGRRIMIGWMQNWDTCSQYFAGKRWQGQMTLPRELSIRDGRLCQRPVRELEGLRGSEVRYDCVVFDGTHRLDGIRGRAVDLELKIEPDGTEIFEKFSIMFAQNKQYYSALHYRPREASVELDRRYSGSRRAVLHQRSCNVKDTNGHLKLRLILDRFSAEVFINDGEQVMSAVLCTELCAAGISFFADRRVRMSLIKYELCPPICS